MNETVQVIPLSRLALALIPVCVVLTIIHRWSLGTRAGLVAVLRMVTQLLLVGYVLTFVFGSNSVAVVLSVVSVMLAAAGWIALRPLGDERGAEYPKVLVAIGVGALTVLLTATQGVLTLSPWHDVSVVIPLAGIVLANSMNTVSLAAERFRAERQRGAGYLDARHIAMSTALIPMTNSLLAVGLVSLPGMMTGQILSGVAPLIAVRYQILVMCMIFGSAGLATSCYLVLQRPADGATTP
ncbi:MAG: ABC transporter permease [Vicinamibacterales bacterium]|jgi:putative ABC transport system permease protein|nr:ABC transporter permease [Vicinamibacterales bacterium]MDP7480490.1 ABC transporter permease [Vicinamibacterales bacterium]MDP7691907.1 ABC transporter permease [Vicinamibacterales bacterium]HJN45890.1 ABC transporter permease [Vicinamibacterales bacterium]